MHRAGSARSVHTPGAPLSLNKKRAETGILSPNIKCADTKKPTRTMINTMMKSRVLYLTPTPSTPT
jgi:hypothetical protein